MTTTTRLLTGALFLLCAIAGHAQGKFEGRVVVEWITDHSPERDMRLLEAFSFTDAAGKKWNVPAGAVVNGASIPRSLWTLAGSPYTGNYRRASVIHDYFCDVKSEPWKKVHRVFFHAMIAAGVSEGQAKVFYAAVYAGGPRWKTVVMKNFEGKDESIVIPQSVSVTPQVENEVAEWIRSENPSLDAIDQRIEAQVVVQ